MQEIFSDDSLLNNYFYVKKTCISCTQRFCFMTDGGGDAEGNASSFTWNIAAKIVTLGIQSAVCHCGLKNCDYLYKLSKSK